jgi:hypothetical protein
MARYQDKRKDSSMSDSIIDGPDTYIIAIPVTEIFADYSYQRPLSAARIKDMVGDWDPRLVGVIDVADRGPAADPRYAVVEGQHRWASAARRNPADVIVARVHSGLTESQEAQLFHDIDAKRRRLGTWDRWKARQRAGDPVVAAINNVAARVGLKVDNSPAEGYVRCVSTLDRIAARRDGELLLRDTLWLLHETWGKQNAAYDTALVSGMALFLTECGKHEAFECDRLVEALIDFTPARISYIAKAKAEHTSGPLPKRVALTFLDRYNTVAGPKLPIPEALTKGTTRGARTQPRHAA